VTDAATMLAMGYRPYSEMPAEYKDGRLVLLGDPDVGWTFPMRWNSRGYNIVFSRKKVGIWEMDGGGLTWTDENPDGAPGWWRLPGSGEDIRDRRPTGVNRGNIF
jgi:hypothetical protein